MEDTYLLIGGLFLVLWAIVSAAISFFRNKKAHEANTAFNKIFSRNGVSVLNSYGISRQTFQECEIQYSECKIKKNGHGIRILRIPADPLKGVQKNLDRFFRARLPVHRCAHAYRKARSTATNAMPHVGSHVVIKLDIKAFFDTITKNQVQSVIKKAFPNSPSTNFERLAELVWLPTGLPQGAPTSPIISNAILFDFDEAVWKYVRRRKGRYTRYADDITISYPADDARKIRRTIKFIAEALEKEGFVLNKKPNKLNVLRPHQSQRICGITINSGKISISRKDRRKLRAIKHKLSLGEKASLTQSQADGLAAYHQHVMNFSL